MSKLLPLRTNNCLTPKPFGSSPIKMIPVAATKVKRFEWMRSKKDCRDSDIAIHVLPLPQHNAQGEKGQFDQSIFYKEFIAPHNHIEDEDGFVDLITRAVDVEAIVENFAIGTRKRRKIATMPLLLPGWKDREGHPGIMLDLYGVVQVRNKPQKISVHQEKNKATIKKTKRINAETGEVVEDEDVHNFANFCGRVSIQPANLVNMKKASNSQDASSLVVHGFRPMKFLPITNLMSKTTIALANDSRVSGSEKALYNLKLSMIKKDVFAVGEMLTRASTTSKMVALVPKNDGFGGFLITQLPYKEDTRKVLPSDIGFADRNSVDAAKKLISKATLNFDHFESCLPENPWLKHFFGYLESVSLGRALGEVEDDTKMDVQQMLENAIKEIESFSLSLPEDDQPIKKERKRKEPPSSKPKFVTERISDEWIDRFKNDELGDLKNDQLKAFLKGQGERVAGKKSDLVDRVIRVIEKELFND